MLCKEGRRRRKESRGDTRGSGRSVEGNEVIGRAGGNSERSVKAEEDW